MNEFLRDCRWIDWRDPDVLACARELRSGRSGDAAIAEACFTFVRDEVQHSVDYQVGPVTCKASEVLRHRVGYCYAKSHLLAALLRANRIPAALCYQRLTLTNEPQFCLHGLNAVYLQEYGWYRIDARGNNQSVNAQFEPPVEQLAFDMVHPGETLFPQRFAQPHPQVIDILTCGKTWDEVYRQLPDVLVL